MEAYAKLGHISYQVVPVADRPNTYKILGGFGSVKIAMLKYVRDDGTQDPEKEIRRLQKVGE